MDDETLYEATITMTFKVRGRHVMTPDHLDAIRSDVKDRISDLEGYDANDMGNLETFLLDASELSNGDDIVVTVTAG